MTTAVCALCGDPLTGRRRRYCSDKCLRDADRAAGRQRKRKARTIATELLAEQREAENGHRLSDEIAELRGAKATGERVLWGQALAELAIAAAELARPLSPAEQRIVDALPFFEQVAKHFIPAKAVDRAGAKGGFSSPFGAVGGGKL